MRRTFSRQANRIRRRAAQASRILLCTLLLLAGVSTTAAAPPEAKADAKQLRAYLPTIRLKAMFANEHDYAAELEDILKLYVIYLEGGLVNQDQKGEVEEQLLQARIRVLQRDRDYHDSLDKFMSRFKVTAERRQQMEAATISPPAKLFRRYENLCSHQEEVWYEAAKLGHVEDAAKLRPALIKLLTTSSLVKKTVFRERFLQRWGEWGKAKGIGKRLTQIKKDRTQLRDRQGELSIRHQDLSSMDRQRLEDLEFDIDLGNLELNLRNYERRLWDAVDEQIQRVRCQDEFFRQVVRSFIAISDHASIERLNRLRRSWPGLSPVRLKDVDLLTCDREKAEQMVASILTTPDAQLPGKRKLRQLRALAEGYPIQQRLFDLAFLRREQIKFAQAWPPRSPTSELASDKLVGPIGRAPPRSDPYAVEPLLKAQASYARARGQLLQTWIDYQMVRLDLYGNLGLPAR